MKSEFIIRQLYDVVPELTDLFSDNINVVSITKVLNTVTVVTATPHGLQTNNVVSIAGAKPVTRIVSLTQVNGIATAITDQDHDLTEGFFPTVEISGATEAGYNGTFELLSVPNRLTFTYRLTSNPTSPATSSGDILLLTAGLGTYNGRFQVTVVNPTTFTYQLPIPLYSPAIGNIKVKKGIRISGAATIERAMDAYTKQQTNKLWAFVILEDTAVNKDRTVRSDAVTTRTVADDFRMRLLKNFSVYVICPSTDTIAARTERDLMEDVEVILYRSLLALKVPSMYTERTWSLITPIGNGTFAYTPAIYVHRYSFQLTLDLLIEDTAYKPRTRAFRDLTLNYFDFEDTEKTNLIATATVDLDDEPIED